MLASYSCEMNYWNYARPEDVGELWRALGAASVLFFYFEAWLLRS